MVKVLRPKLLRISSEYVLLCSRSETLASSKKTISKSVNDSTGK